MRSTTRRAVAIAAAGLIAVAGAGVLTACGGSGSDTASSSAAAPTDEGAQVIGPVIVEAGQTTAEVSVGRFVTFNVDDVTAWTIASSDPTVLVVTPGKDDGSAQFLPGGEALAAGTAEVVLTNSGTGEEWVVTVTVTQ